MDDSISRQAVIGTVKKHYRVDNDLLEVIVYELENLPSAQPERCENAVSRNAIIQKLNTMDRYVSEELILCDTDKRFPKNEVFIVDDIYEEIVENLPSAQPEPHYDEWCDDCKEYDKERHCCPRWNRVIRQALKDAQPEPHEGYWIPHEGIDGDIQYECSKCGVLWQFNYGTPEDNEAYFCPKCGAKMKGEQDAGK